MTTAAAAASPLDSGDRLDRVEFHRRYCAHPEIRKAELILGVVYVPSPTRYDLHDEQQSWMVGWLAYYGAHTPGVRVGTSASIFLDDYGEVQPDAFLFRAPPPPGGARVRGDRYIEGAPQLIVEIAASSVNYDLHDKKEAYRRAGVEEYIVWRTLDAAIDWFRLVAGEYVRVEPNRRGVIESAAFPGLRLLVPAMLHGEIAKVLAALRRRRSKIV